MNSSRQFPSRRPLTIESVLRASRIEIAGRDGEFTFAEIGQRLNISGVRARELYLNGMNKLRARLLHSTLEIELAVGQEEVSQQGSSGNSGARTDSGSAGRWDAIKQRLTKKQAGLIDVLLLQGRMNRTHIAKALKSDYTYCRKHVIAPLLAQGLLVEAGDGLLDLKSL